MRNAALRFLIGFVLTLASSFVFSQKELRQDTLKIGELIRNGKAAVKTNPVNGITILHEGLKAARELKFEYHEAMALKEIGTAYYYLSNYDSVKYYWENSNNILLHYGGQPLGDSYNNLGVFYLRIGNSDTSRIYFNKSLSIREAIGDSMKMADSYLNIGGLERQSGLFDKALKNYFAGLKIYEDLNNEAKIADAYNSIGLVYMAIENHESALKYLLKSYNIKLRLNNPRSLGSTLINLATEYSLVEEFELSIKYFEEAKKIFEAYNDVRNLSGIQSNLSNIYKNQGNEKKAINLLLEAIPGFEKLNDPEGLAVAYNNLGALYLLEKNWKEAEKVLLKAIYYSELSGSLEMQLQANHALAELYTSTKKFEKAMKYNEIYVAINDTLFNKSVAEEIVVLQEKYEAEKKAKKIIELKNEALLQEQNRIKQRNFYLAVIGVIALALLILIIVVNRIRYKRKILIKEQKAYHLNMELKERELNEKNRELITYAGNSVQKNKLLNDLFEIIENLDFNNPDELYTKIRDVRELIKSTLESNEVWNKFKIHFENVHPDFFNSLKNKFPQLTQNDLKQAAYIRMNLSSKDVAIMMNITPKSAKMNRYRLKKKLDLNVDESLGDYLMKIESI